MRMHYAHSLSHSRIAQIVGTFVAIPLFVLAVVGLFMAKAEHVFDRKYNLVTTLSKSYGLEPGAPVLMSGIPIGRVDQIDFNEQGRVDVTLLLRSRYQHLVREDSEARVGKSGVVVGQTQVEIAQGTPARPVLTDGAVLKAVEPKDVAELIDELEPILQAVKQTLLRVEAITQDVQTTVQAGGKSLERVAEAADQLPEVVASVRRTVASVEETAASLPDMTRSVQRSLAMVDQITRSVTDTTARLPSVIESAGQTMNSVQSLTSAVTDATRELDPLLHTTHAALDDVSTLVRGAKNTFPFSRFARNAGPPPSPSAGSPLINLRADQLAP